MSTWTLWYILVESLICWYGYNFSLKSLYLLLSKIVVLNLWVTNLWGLNNPFPGVNHDYQKTQIFLLWFITAEKLQLWSSKAIKIILFWGSPRHVELIKSHRIRKVDVTINIDKLKVETEITEMEVRRRWKVKWQDKQRHENKYRKMWIVFHSYPVNFMKIMSFQETSKIFGS